MRQSVKDKLIETRDHMQNYMDSMESTKELRKMCQNCERYAGKQHDYDECHNRQCFKFWLAYEYLEWVASCE